MTSRPAAGVWDTDGGPDWRNDAGDEGGAIKGRNIEVELVEEEFWSGATTPPEDETGSGTSTAWPIRLLFF